MSALHKEVAEYDDFILLDIQEEYSKLPYKTCVLRMTTFMFFICSVLLNWNSLITG